VPMPPAPRSGPTRYLPPTISPSNDSSGGKLLAAADSIVDMPDQDYLKHKRHREIPSTSGKVQPPEGVLP